jgi:hypothetical protein
VLEHERHGVQVHHDSARDVLRAIPPAAHVHGVFGELRRGVSDAEGVRRLQAETSTADQHAHHAFTRLYRVYNPAEECVRVFESIDRHDGESCDRTDSAHIHTE